MASSRDIPLLDRTSHSAESVETTLRSPDEVAAPATPDGLANAHPRGIEREDTSPLNVLPRPGGLHVPASGEPQSLPQAPPQAISNIASNSTVVTSNVAAQQPKQGYHRHLQGNTAQENHSYVDRSYDYLRKYPPDAEGKELDPDARVWKVYLDESGSYDDDMIKNFQHTIDSLLVFAGLFSSIIASFVTYISEDHYEFVQSTLLFEQVQILRANGNATLIEVIPRSLWTPYNTDYSSLDATIEWMFFASLVLSLATSFVAVLIKQWLQEFTALVPGDAKRRSLTRQFRFAGLQKWKMHDVVNILPLLLHLALAFFLIGLCLFAQYFHSSLSFFVWAATVAIFAFYIITGILPAVRLDCPYRLTIFFIPACVFLYFFRMIRFKISEQIRKLTSQLISDSPSSPVPSLPRPSLSVSPLHSQEWDHISNKNTKLRLEGFSLEWLFSQTPSPSVQRVALHGISRFVQRDKDEKEGNPTFSEAGFSLQDSLPLRDMSETAIAFFIAEAQPDDGPLLRDLVVSSRQFCREPVLPASAWAAVAVSPYTLAFLKANVLQAKWDRDMIMEVVRMDKWDVVKHLLNSSQDLRSWELIGCNILPFASVAGVIPHEDWLAIFTMANKEGIDLNTSLCIQKSQSTLLHLISSYGTVAALQHLIELISGVPDHNINVADHFGSTPLHFACDRGKNYPELENDDEGTSLKALGAHANNSAIFKQPAPLVIQTLLSKEANPDSTDNKGYLPLHNACSNGFRDFGSSEAGLEAIRKLVEATRNINQCSEDGLTPLDLLKESDRRDTAEGKAGYKLMTDRGARLGAVEDEDEDTDVVADAAGGANMAAALSAEGGTNIATAPNAEGGTSQEDAEAEGGRDMEVADAEDRNQGGEEYAYDDADAEEEIEGEE